ncbi:MAG: hypothetical protein R3338_14310, partial [Thermoanaerobaculia bacterium]|nr:hypothetical protein [Thermoanaerobaculia bacterium]
MTPIDLAILVTLSAVTAVVPPLLLRRNLERWAIAESLFWSGVVVCWAAGRLLEIDLEGSLLFSIGFVSRTTFFVGVILWDREEAIVWNPGRAARATGFV